MEGADLAHRRRHSMSISTGHPDGGPNDWRTSRGSRGCSKVVYEGNEMPDSRDQGSSGCRWACEPDTLMEAVTRFNTGCFPGYEGRYEGRYQGLDTLQGL